MGRIYSVNEFGSLDKHIGTYDERRVYTIDSNGLIDREVGRYDEKRIYNLDENRMFKKHLANFMDGRIYSIDDPTRFIEIARYSDRRIYITYDSSYECIAGYDGSDEGAAAAITVLVLARVFNLDQE